MRNLMTGCSMLFLLGCLESDGPLLASPASSPTSPTGSLLRSSSSSPRHSPLDPPKFLLLDSSGSPPQIPLSSAPGYRRLGLLLANLASSGPRPSLGLLRCTCRRGRGFSRRPLREGDSQMPVSSDAAAGVVEASAEPTDTSPEDLDYIREVKRVLELLQKNRDMTFG